MLPSFMYDMPFVQERRKRAQEQYEKVEKPKRIAACVPFDPQMKWEPHLNIKAETYPKYHLFNVKPLRDISINLLDKKNVRCREFSPKKTWVYCETLVPAGYRLDTWNGRYVGDLIFDKPVVTPGLWEVARLERGDPHCWMSIAPTEIFSLRAGTRLAKGHTVIAGLGLGWQLIQVLRRKQVKKVTVVEKDQELVDWLLPRILQGEENVGKNRLQVIVGDAYEELPKLTADVALVDIFDGYGGNKDDTDRIRDSSPNIRSVWGWGTQFVLQSYSNKLW